MGSSLPHRIGRITENLRVIEDEISHLAQQELLALSRGTRIGDTDVKALKRVKSSVDHLRQVLRCYIDFASAQVEGGGAELANDQAKRTTIILKYACDRLQLHESPHQNSVSLFDQLMHLAFAAVDRQKQSSPIELAAAVGDD